MTPLRRTARLDGKERARAAVVFCSGAAAAAGRITGEVTSSKLAKSQLNKERAGIAELQLTAFR
jgi:hypothetical protein